MIISIDSVGIFGGAAGEGVCLMLDAVVQASALIGSELRPRPSHAKGKRRVNTAGKAFAHVIRFPLQREAPQIAGIPP